jgi:excisionase family DNA binding protein
MEQDIIDRLTRIEILIAEQNSLQKEVLTFEEALVYTGISESHMYKLTSKKLIPHSKPRGKLINFDRKKLDAWRLSNPVITFAEIDARTSTYTSLNKVRS